MSYLDVYKFESPHIYLLEVFNERKSFDENFSMRKWAKEMDLKSHSILNFLMTGRRGMRLSHVDFLSKGMKLDQDESSYLKALIQFEQAKTADEKELIALLLKELNPREITDFKVIENLKAVSDWSYATILSICDLSNFDGEMETIFKSLGGKLSISEVREKVLRLKKIGLLNEDEAGRLYPVHKKTSVPNDIKSEGVRLYHKSVLEMSKSALDEVELAEREFQSFAISMDKMKTPKVKKMIRNFLAKLEEETQSDYTDNVYQFNIQFFRLTQDSLQNSGEVINPVAPVIQKNTQEVL